ncbi:MAG: hypothetical protein GC205_01225 [Bacteroidetes bacterium]|nr:hypothetical protein [Bacteroidota bacterium]
MSGIKQVFLFLLGALFLHQSIQAQGRTANWIFGDGYHIKYTDGVPEVMPFVESFRANEAATCISDTGGTLLFFSNSSQLWNRNFQPLWNSDTLSSVGGTKTNGTIILPWPGDEHDTYFIHFYIDGSDSKLYYNKVNINLDGGLGGVVPEQKQVLVWDHPVCEQLSAVRHANGRDWWVISRKGLWESTHFDLLLLTPAGIVQMHPQFSGYRGGFGGEMTISRYGSLLAIATTDDLCFPNPPTIALYDFDRCTGEIQLRDTLLIRECHNNSYGLAFSASGSKLYYSLSNRFQLYQIETSHDVLVDSLILKLAGPSFSLMYTAQLELAVNGQIVLGVVRLSPTSGTDGFADHLIVIREPELEGIACYVDTFGIYLNGRENSSYSLPNFANYDLGPIVGSPCDTLSPQDTTLTSLHHPPIETLSWSINPSIGSGSFTVTGGPSSWLVVHDLYGREVLRLCHEGSTPFDLMAQPAGVYLVYLRAADGTQTLPRKIVRQ